MSIAFGVYDVFSFILPGYLYLFEIFYIIYIFFPNPKMVAFVNTINIAHVILISILAYALGHIFGVLARWLWHFMFNYKKMRTEILNEVKVTYAELNIKFDSELWPVFYSIIQQENPEHINEIRWMDANHIMFRNLGLGLIIFSGINCAQYFQNFEIVHLFVAVFCLVLTLLTIIRSRDYIWHYFFMIYSAIIGRSIKDRKVVIVKKQ